MPLLWILDGALEMNVRCKNYVRTYNGNNVLVNNKYSHLGLAVLDAQGFYPIDRSIQYPSSRDSQHFTRPNPCNISMWWEEAIQKRCEIKQEMDIISPPLDIR